LEKNEFKYKELTEKIIGAAYTFHSKLGFGFLEKVYHNSLLIELDSFGLEVRCKIIGKSAESE